MPETSLGFIHSGIKPEPKQACNSIFGIVHVGNLRTFLRLKSCFEEGTRSEKPTVSPEFSGLRDNRVVPTKRTRDMLLSPLFKVSTEKTEDVKA